MKQGDLIKFDVTSLGDKGEGVGRLGNDNIYAVNAIDGERAVARVSYAKRNTVFADVKEIINKSPFRQEPICDRFLKCGGCQLQHMSYAKQLDFKRSLLAKNMKNIGGFEIDVPNVVASPLLRGYRNKVQLPVGIVGGKVAVGFYANNSHKLVPVAHCPLQEKWAKDMAEAFLCYLDAADVAVYDEIKHKGLVRHIIGRYIEGQLLVTVVINGEELPTKEVFINLLSKKFDNFGLFINKNTKKTNVILGGKSKWIYGLQYINADINGIKFVLRPDSFFQVNWGIAELLYAEVKKHLSQTDTEVIVDCYSGVGILSALLYSENIKAYAIEIEQSAVADADYVKEQNGLVNLTNICGDVAENLPEIFKKNQNKNIAVVVDPPRKGLAAKTVELFRQTMPQQIVYISCDSATLARDVKLLCQNNLYQITHIQPFDMFPYTRHVETVVLITRAKE